MRKKLAPLDKSGREIKPGDTIVYGHVLGRSGALQYGKIIALKQVSAPKWNYTTNQEEGVPVTHFTVQGVSYYDEESKPSLLRRGTLQFGDRILVLHEDQVPASVRELLATVEILPTEQQPTQG